MNSALRAKLREATAPSHAKIEANTVLSQLTSATLTESAYRQILERYYGFFVAFEAALQADSFSEQVAKDLKVRFKSTDLRADLLSFGETDLQIDSLEVCHELPALESRAQILGALYVLEGSALGGLLISKHLSGFSFYRPERGSFFLADPKTVSTNWKAFLERLEGVPFVDEDEVIASAVLTFDLLDRWMAVGA